MKSAGHHAAGPDPTLAHPLALRLANSAQVMTSTPSRTAS
jgi:hypothetical protein